jgi:surface protein
MYIYIYLYIIQMSSDAVIDDSHLILNYKIGDDAAFPYKIQLPIREITSDITIDWGDGTNATTHGDDYPEHDYAYINNGEHTITISGGQFSHFGYIKPPEIEEPDPLIGISSLRGLIQWGSYEITNMSGAFYNATGLLSVPDYIPDNVTDLSSMFERALSFNQDISSWNVSNVERIKFMFQGATNFNNGDTGNNGGASFDGSTFSLSLGQGDPDKTIDMSSMFQDATAFNQSISSWDVSKVTTMSFMFQNATAFNQNISSWDVSKVTNMSGMFLGATAFNNGDPENNGSAPFTTQAGASTFSSSLGGGTDNKTIVMSSMFLGATAFNQNISSWNVSKVTNMSTMFFGAIAFNNGDPGNNGNAPFTTQAGGEHIFFITGCCNQRYNNKYVRYVFRRRSL